MKPKNNERYYYKIKIESLTKKTFTKSFIYLLEGIKHKFVIDLCFCKQLVPFYCKLRGNHQTGHRVQHYYPDKQ
jgi:hypothetical protein